MQLARTLLNPTRIRILGAVADAPASSSQLAATLGENANIVAYHVEVLRATGCLQPTGAAQAGREDECTYELVPSATPTRHLPQPGLVPPVFCHPSAAALRAVVNSGVATETGIGEHQGDQLSCVSIVLDRRGMREVSAAIGGVLDRVSVAHEESTQRLAGSGEEGINATIAVARFESPQRDVTIG